jgi:hypothetical protein
MGGSCLRGCSTGRGWFKRGALPRGCKGVSFVARGGWVLEGSRGGDLIRRGVGAGLGRLTPLLRSMFFQETRVHDLQ